MVHVVDRDAGVLAEQVVGVLGHRMLGIIVPSTPLRGGVGLAAREALEAVLDVGRQDLQRADVELARGLLDLREVDLHSAILAP